MKTALRKIHRWLGLLMALQIIAWMASGLYFSLFPIAEIRGEHLTRSADSLPPSAMAAAGIPMAVEHALDRHFDGPWSLSSFSLAQVDGEVFWRVSGESRESRFTRLVTTKTPKVVPALDRQDAAKTAENWLLQPARVIHVEWVDPTPGTDYRGHHGPAWKVDFEHEEGLSLYLHPWTGEVLARRTNRWRVFDFLWMLHIMDYDTRDDFNHPLLLAAALGGLIIALSGVVYWFLSSRFLRRRRSPAAA